MKDVKLFQSNQIRSVWNDEAGEWFFSVVDVVGALTDSADKSAYWRKLKQRLKAEGSETVTNCHRLKLQAEDGKMRLTDTANTEGILRIIQSIPRLKLNPSSNGLHSLVPTVSMTSKQQKPSILKALNSLISLKSNTASTWLTAKKG